MIVSGLRRATKITLVVCNILVGIALVLGCYAGQLESEAYWIAGLFNLGTFYIVLLLFGFFLFWIFAKWSLAVISVLAIVICWKPLKNVAIFRSHPNFELAKDEGALRVMTWNVEHFDILEHKTHPERKQEMLELINIQKPDVACFQEVVASENDSSAINYLPELVQELGFKNYHYSYNPKLDFDSKHHFGIITLSRYPIINRKTIVFPPADYNSIFQFIDIKKDEDTFRVINVHLQSLKFSKVDKTYIEDPTLKDQVDFEESRSVIEKLRASFSKRSVQSDRIRSAIDASPYPVIVCGDFNDAPNSYAYRKIGSGLKNVFSERGSGLGRTYAGISPTLRIDHIFVHPGFDVLQYLRVKKKLSDHFPVTADIRYR